MAMNLTDSQKYLLLSAFGDPKLRDSVVELLENAVLLEGTFPNFASLPTTNVADGSLAITLDTSDIYVFDLQTTTWIGASTDISSLNGLTAPSQTFSIGTAGADFNISSAGSVHTYNLPNASATARGVVSTGTQTFAGDKTMSNNLSILAQLSLSAGSAANPSLNFTTDSNTGLFLGGTDTIGFAGNGSTMVGMQLEQLDFYSPTATAEQFIRRQSTEGSIIVRGGTTSSAGTITVYGQSHAAFPSHIRLSNVAGLVANFTETGRVELGEPSYTGNGSTPQRIYGTTKMGPGLGLFAGASTGDYSYVGYNVRSAAGADTYNYDGGDTASMIKFQNGGIDLRGTSTVGSAGGAITFTQLMRVSNDGRARFTDGTAASPSISFIDGNTNGFYRTGSTSFGASANGVEIQRFASSGIQAVGTTAAPFSIRANVGDSTGLLVYLNGSGNAFIHNSVPNGQLQLGTDELTSILIDGSQNVEISLGDLSIETAGKGLLVKEGSNAKMGVATLVAGTVTVNTTAVAANSRIFLTHQNNSGTVGFVTVSARTAATSFTILSSNAADTSDIAWIIIDPA